jgi:hypothetical protein
MKTAVGRSCAELLQCVGLIQCMAGAGKGVCGVLHVSLKHILDAKSEVLYEWVGMWLMRWVDAALRACGLWLRLE